MGKGARNRIGFLLIRSLSLSVDSLLEGSTGFHARQDTETLLFLLFQTNRIKDRVLADLLPLKKI